MPPGLSWPLDDTRTALAAMAQVFATFAALGGGFGILRFQVLTEKRRALERRFFAAIEDLAALSGEKVDLVALRNAGTYLPYWSFVEWGREMLKKAQRPAEEPGQRKPRPKLMNVVHARVAYKTTVKALEALPGETVRTLFLTTLPVILNGLACAASLWALLTPTVYRTVAAPGGHRAVLSMALLVVGVTVTSSAFLLFELARQPREKPIDDAHLEH